MASEPKPDDAHSLKIGFQTILWGPRLPSVEHVLHILTQAGFQGVEFAQRPKYLGSIDDLLRTAERIGMRLLGLAGGTIRERVEFCKDYKDLYLYVEEWNEKEATYAIEHGFTLALHPHMFKPVQRLEEAYACLDQHSALRFLPDTAHLHIAGDNCAEAVRGRYKDLAAVHIKDWKPDYGRSSHRYAHGFTELGKGEVEPTIAEVLDLLCEKKYDGWVIAEQDWSSSTPEDSVFACASWLHENGYLGCKPEMPETRASRPVPVLGDAGKAYQFAKALKWASTLDQASCYDAIATAFHDICRCKMVTVWTCTPAQDLISLVSLKTDPTVPMPERVLPLDRCTLRCRDIPAGEAIAELDIKSFDLTDSTVASRYGHRELIEKLGLTRMVSVPIFNVWNPNHARWLVNLFPYEDGDVPDDGVLHELAQIVGLAADAALVGVCATVAAQTASRTQKSHTAGQCLDEAVKHVQETLQCEGVSIFLVNEDPEPKLEAAATTGLEWLQGEHFYRQSEGITGTIWRTRQTLLTLNPNDLGGVWQGKSREQVALPGKHDCLFTPLVDSARKVCGVVRCRNKKNDPRLGKETMFSDDDAALLESIVQAVVPYFEIRRAQDKRNEVFSKSTHEIKGPLTCIREEAASIRRLFPRGASWTGNRAREHVKEITHLYDAAIGIVHDWEISKTRERNIYYQFTPTILRSQVIERAISMATYHLRDREFSRRAIQIVGFDAIPRLHVSRQQFQQVFLNLLTNAIKYAYDDRTAFSVEIEARETPNEFVISFRDRGPGVPAGWEKRIFDYGTRAPRAEDYDVQGMGIGLWIARTVIEVHGGTMSLTSRHRPTEFTIRLPRSLERATPRGFS